MKMKKILAMAMCLVLGASMLIACGKTDKADETEKTASTEESASANPMEMITEGYYSYSYPVEGIGDFTYFLHFYDEVPGIGNVFYTGYCLNQINFAGTYVVEEKDYEYACYAKRGDTELVNGTAPYTVTFYDWNGNVLDSCGFDGEILYNDMETMTAQGSGPAYYTHDTEGEKSSYYETYAAEAGISYLAAVGETDETSTLTLYHNGTYMDLVNTMVEGKWGLTSTDEKGSVITLTPNSDSDKAVTLNVSADQSTIIYTPAGGEAVNLINVSMSGAAVKATMNGTIPIPGQDGVNGDLILTMYDDGTCGVLVNVFGTEMQLDAGTYALADDGFTINFTLDSAGALSSVLNSETGAITLDYISAGTDLGDIDCVLTLNPQQ